MTMAKRPMTHTSDDDGAAARDRETELARERLLNVGAHSDMSPDGQSRQPPESEDQSDHEISC